MTITFFSPKRVLVTGGASCAEFTDEKIGKSMMSSPELKKVSCNIAESHLADYNKMNKVSCHHIMKLEASQ